MAPAPSASNEACPGFPRLGEAKPRPPLPDHLPARDRDGGVFGQTRDPQ